MLNVFVESFLAVGHTLAEHGFGVWAALVSGFVVSALLYFAGRLSALERSLGQRGGIAEHLNQKATYTRIQHIIATISESHPVDRRTLDIAPLHGFSLGAAKPPSRRSIANVYMRARREFLLRHEGKVRELLLISTGDQLDYVLNNLQQFDNLPCYLEVKAFPSAHPPLLAPLIIGDEHVFIGLEDHRETVIERSIYIRSVEAQNLVKRYFNRLWSDDRAVSIRGVNGIDTAGIEAIRQIISGEKPPGSENHRARNSDDRDTF